MDVSRCMSADDYVYGQSIEMGSGLISDSQLGYLVGDLFDTSCTTG